MKFPEKIPVTLDISGAPRTGWKATFPPIDGGPAFIFWHLDGFALDVMSHRQGREVTDSFAAQIPFGADI